MDIQALDGTELTLEISTLSTIEVEVNSEAEQSDLGVHCESLGMPMMASTPVKPTEVPSRKKTTPTTTVTHECNVDGCSYITKIKKNLKRHTMIHNNEYI